MPYITRRGLLGGMVVGGASILAACGQVPAPAKEAAKPAEKPAASEAKPAAEAPKAKEVKTVTVWYTTFEIWDFNKAPVPMKLREQFDATSGFKLDPVIRPNGGFDDLPTVVAAGSAPDVSKTQSWIQPQWGVLELVRPLDNYIRSAKHLSFNDSWKFKVEEVQFQGKTYAAPYSLDARLMFINTNHYLEAGLDPQRPPATWDEMDQAIAKTFKTRGDQIAQLSWDPYRGSGGQGTWMVPYWQLGGDIFNAEKTKFTVNNEKAVQALTWHMKVFNAQGGWGKIAAFHKDQQSRVQFGNGLMTHFYEANELRANDLPKYPALKWTFAAYPIPAGGRKANYAGGWAFCLPNGSKNPDGGFAFIDFMYSADVDLQWALTMDRIPVRRSVGQSDKYAQGDAFRKLVIAEMENGRFWPGVPGITGVRNGLAPFFTSILEGKATIPEALKEWEAKGQKEIDDFLAKLKE